MDKEAFIKLINKSRREAGGKQWYGGSYVVNNKTVHIKAFGNWIQVLKVDGIDHATHMTTKVADFNKILLGGLE